MLEECMQGIRNALDRVTSSNFNVSALEWLITCRAV